MPPDGSDNPQVAKSFAGAADDAGQNSKVAKIALKYGMPAFGVGIAGFGITSNFRTAWEQVEKGKYTAAAWTTGVMNLPEFATLAEVFAKKAADGSALKAVAEFAPVKFMGGPLGYLAIEGVQQLVNETTGWVPPSILSYGINSDVNMGRAREALFPGDAEIEATTRNTAIDKMGITPSENGPLPSEMMAMSQIQYPEPALEKFMALMPQFATFKGNFMKMKDGAFVVENNHTVPDKDLNKLAADMYRMENSGEPGGYQNAREIFRNFIENRVIERAGELSRQRGINSWDGERVPQNIMNEVAPEILKEFTGQNDGKDFGIYGGAQAMYMRSAVLYLDPAYNSTETIKLADGQPMGMYEASGEILNELFEKNKVKIDWKDKGTQNELRTYMSARLSQAGFKNVPDADRQPMASLPSVSNAAPAPMAFQR